VVRGILNSSHHNAGDFNVIVPAELLAQQKRTEQLFNTVIGASLPFLSVADRNRIHAGGDSRANA